eukprot:scaffold33517_cov32-Tisochrysis_lutea.AAC.2
MGATSPPCVCVCVATICVTSPLIAAASQSAWEYATCVGDIIVFAEAQAAGRQAIYYTHGGLGAAKQRDAHTGLGSLREWESRLTGAQTAPRWNLTVIGETIL